MSNVFTAWNAVMTTVRSVGKDGFNSSPGGNYKFRGIDAVVNAVGPACREHGVTVVPVLIKEKVAGQIEVGKNRTVMGHVSMTIVWRVYGPEGDYFEGEAASEAMDSGDKAVSKAHSVSYRTFLIQALCLPTDEPDPDQETYQRSEARPPAPAMPPVDPLIALKRELLAIAADNGHDLEWLRGDYFEWSTGQELGAADIGTLTEYRKHLKPEGTTKMRRA